MTLALGLHMEGANDSTVFTDMAGHSYTASAPRIKTAEYAPITGSTASCYFDGTGGITYDASSKYAVDTATTPFTLGCWIKTSTNQTNGVAATLYLGRVSAAGYISLFVNVGTYINFTFNDGGSGLTGSGNHDKTQWHYVQITRGAEAFPNDSKVHLCVDGVRDPASAINETSLYGPGGSPFYVGTEPGGTPRHYNGYIDDLFFLTNVAFPDNYVPTTKFTDPLFWTNFVNSQELVT